MNLKEWRKDKGLSQEACAASLAELATQKNPQAPRKLSQRTFSNWESGGAMPRQFWLKIIAEFTKDKVTANDFIGVSG